MKFIKENYANFYGSNKKESSYGKPVKVVERLGELLPHGSVLDLGAGDGRHALFLASKGLDVTAVDLSEAALEKLQEHAKEQGLQVKTELADLSDWSIENDYDAMVIVVTLQHLKTEDALRVLGEMKSHTKPGGLNAVSLFTKTGDRYAMDREEDPDAFYPEDGWIKDYYKDWEILTSAMRNAPIIGRTRPDGTPMENNVEVILAKKPTE
ncbi:methyltransferase domain-containing protein [Candidatus Uhrbacteria bacterium]|nr:methyltransferase domain-containing protein [Candidatus Uhrbacteria bacterium]